MRGILNPVTFLFLSDFYLLELCSDFAHSCYCFILDWNHILKLLKIKV